MSRLIFFCTMRAEVINAEMAAYPGGFILAATHLGNLEPAICGVLSCRPIDWMARKEFYGHWLARPLLNAVGTFSVNRQGIATSAVRTAIHRVRAGRIVGICPEGGVTSGSQAVINGGPIRRGCCSVSIRAAAPIVPCVILGTERLNGISPWLPFRRGRLFIAYGQPIHPPAGARSTRFTRAELGERVRASFRALYAQLRERYDVRESPELAFP
jgi:1-acyl-sn-glycerol-3-phosphate acyltransferase